MSGAPSGGEIKATTGPVRVLSRRERWEISVGVVAVPALFWILNSTVRLQKVVGEQYVDRWCQTRSPVILASWHNRTLYCGHFFRRRLAGSGVRIAALASLSKDGEVFARVARRWGFDVVRGSTSRAGLSAFRQMHRLLKRDRISVGTTPDGPRGPMQVAQPGTVMLARTSGAPILPIAYAVDRFWRLRSWDRFVIPKPFARAVMVIGEPIRVTREQVLDDLPATARQLGETLDELVNQAEQALR